MLSLVHVICFYKSMSCIFVESRLLLIVSKLTFVGMGKCGLISLKSLPFTLCNILYFTIFPQNISDSSSPSSFHICFV